MTTAPEERNPSAIDYPVRWLPRRLHALFAGFRIHFPIYVLSIGTYAASLVQSYLLGRPPSIGLAGLASNLVLILIAGVIAYRVLDKLITLWRSGYDRSPSVALLRYLCNDFLTPGRISNSFHVFLATSIFAMGFTNIKSNIPATNPFGWDEALMMLDKTLHLGMLPHQLLMPAFGHPVITSIMSASYKMWFFVMLGFLLWQGYREKNTPLRQQFLIAFFLVWISGTALLGTVFSSVGPCFYGRLLPGDDPYGGLMQYLRSASTVYPIWAVEAQDALWDNYVSSKGMTSGISAMPSMHVASAVLFFFCARDSGIRWLTWASGAFAVVVFLGSILLAWHYAVDGYAGALIALACWWLAGRWVGSHPGLSSRPS